MIVKNLLPGNNRLSPLGASFGVKGSYRTEARGAEALPLSRGLENEDFSGEIDANPVFPDRCQSGLSRMFTSLPAAHYCSMRRVHAGSLARLRSPHLLDQKMACDVNCLVEAVIAYIPHRTRSV